MQLTQDGDVAMYEKKGTLTVSTGTPDTYPALVHEPVGLYHEELRHNLVLLMEDEHRRKRRCERGVWHRNPRAARNTYSAPPSARYVYMIKCTHIHTCR